MLDFLYGNKKIKTILSGFAGKRRFPSSLIISGPSGSGKKTVAGYIAMTLGCETKGTEPCGVCSSCRKIAENSSPDVVSLGLEDGKKTITVDDIRGLRSDAFIAPNELDCKVYIIRNADKMLASAQNCLLKIFEEPPESVYFLLLCENSSSLLPTVRSRAPELRMEVFSDEELKKIVVSENPAAAEMESANPKKLTSLVRRSCGCVGRIRALLDGDDENDSTSEAGDLTKMLCQDSFPDFMVKMQEYCSTRESASSVIAGMMAALRDIITCKRNREGAELMFYADRSDAAAMGGTVSLRTALNMFDMLSGCLDELENTNVNVSSSVTALCAELKKLK
ncbi:MAG: DNA polymerase III subunit [Clostridia bacterium]|nr:DNA polymerase III subunit [Clostridia bacterium]